MNLSISQRLSIMFAAMSVVMLTLISVAMHGLLKRELERHQSSELQTRWQINQPSILKANAADRWHLVRDKFDAITPAGGRVQFWVLSEDPRFRYGAASAAVAALSTASDGFGTLSIDGEEQPRKTYLGTVAANGERPRVRLLVALDSDPFVETLQAFTVGLIVVTIAGALVAAALGYSIAGIGLRPLGRLSREAETLTPERLSQRLDTAPLPPELSKLAHSFNGALDRLESAYQQLEAFNADVAHELRTPLTNLIGQTQVMLSRERDAVELKDVLHSNLEDLERLRSIVNDMLFLARADRGERAPNRVAVSLAQEVARTVEFLEYVLEEAGVTVRVEGDAQASIESALFRRAITNLLQNAVEHSSRGAEIVVQISQQASQVRISVQNRGSVIAPEHLTRMFDRFYRVDKARSRGGENHGLGLAIVKAVAAMHGGAVFALSNTEATTVGFTVA